MSSKYLIVSFFFSFLCITKLHAQSPGDYRSKQTGLWSAITSWETYDGANWINAATAPSSTNGIVTILASHIITSSAALTADQVKINTGGTLKITAAVFTLNDGTGTDMDCDGTFELAGGTLSGAGFTSVNANSVFNWTAGTNAGVGIMTINAGAVASVSGATVHNLGESRVLNNHGTLTWTGGTFTFSTGQAIFNNYAEFNIYTDGDIATAGVSNPTFSNRSTGIINKIGSPTDETAVAAAIDFDNGGTININSSSLQFWCDLENSATINIGFGASLDLRSGTPQANTGSVITGDGNIICGGATVMLNAGAVAVRNFTVSAGIVNNAIPLTFNTDQSLNISSGTFNSSSEVSLNTGSTFNWSNGTIGGNGIMNLNSGCVAEMTVGTRYIADNKVLNNYGNWTWTAGAFYFHTGAPIVNNYGVFNINTDADAGVSGVTTGTFNNKSTGVINKTGAFDDQTYFSGAGAGFTNAGTININSGSLQFSINATNTGIVNINFGSTLNFYGGTTNINTGTSVTGEGSLHFSGATASINAGTIGVKNINISAGIVSLNTALAFGTDQLLDLSGGTFNGTGTINFNSGSTFNWEAGYNGGSGVMNINAGAVFNMTVGAHYLADSKTLNNYGTWQWDGGIFTYYNGSATANNYGSWNIETDADVGNSGGTGALTNKSTGTITKNGSISDPSLFTGITLFSNEGTINLQSGMMKFNTSVNNSGSINIDVGSDINFSAGNTAINAGSVLTGEGNLNFDGTTAAINAGSFSVKRISIAGGTVTLTPSLTIAAGNSLDLSAGTFNGTGNITFSSGSAFTWKAGTNGGSGIITINAGADFIMNTSTHYLAETKSINNYGHWVWTDGPFTFYNGSSVANNYGIFDISTDDDITASASTGSFNNKSTGIINKNGSSVHETVMVGISAFNNEGAVNIASGGLQLNVAGVHSGTYDLSFGAALEGSLNMSFTGPTFSNNGSVSLTSIAFDAAAVQTLDGIGAINTLTINNTVGVMQTGEQTILTKINIHPNSRLTVYHDLNVN